MTRRTAGWLDGGGGSVVVFMEMIYRCKSFLGGQRVLPFGFIPCWGVIMLMGLSPGPAKVHPPSSVFNFLLFYLTDYFVDVDVAKSVATFSIYSLLRTFA